MQQKKNKNSADNCHCATLQITHIYCQFESLTVCQSLARTGWVPKWTANYKPNCKCYSARLLAG